MSPYLRTMFEDAADDGDRPVGLDLAAIRAAGRRAIWRQRILVGGGGIGAAAVITTVALVVSPGGVSVFDPAAPATNIPSAGTYEDEIAAAIAPLIDELAARGYDVDTGGTGVMGAAAGAGSEGEELAGPPDGATAAVLPVTKDGGAGALVVAEFSDISMLSALSSASGPVGEVCAVWMVNAPGDAFAWDWCWSEPGSAGVTVSSAEAGADDLTAIGVTWQRSDGTGISVTLAKAGVDEGVGPGRRPLDELPLTVEELAAAGAPLLDLDTLFPAFDEPTAAPDGTEGPPSGAPPSGMPTVDPCAEAVPADGMCEAVGSATIEFGPLVDALLNVGVVAEEVGGTGSGGGAGGVAQSVLFRLRDSAGRSGSASVGIATGLESAPLMNDTSVAWCAVTPTYERNFAWYLADEPSRPCADADHERSNPLVVVHDEEGSDAIGATLVRSDGSVISVSVSQDPGMAGPGEDVGAPLAELPIDRDVILAVIEVLDRANAAS